MVSYGDAATATLSLVCSRWWELVGDDMFRRRVHFGWLSTVRDWENASPEFRKQCYVMYGIYELFGCRHDTKTCLDTSDVGARETHIILAIVRNCVEA